MRLQIRLRGVRGSVATPGAGFLDFGGNTPCLEVTTPSGEMLIFDAGTGIRGLAPIDSKIFLSHFHWDHLQGLPFFAPLFRPHHCVSFYSGASTAPLREALRGQMTAPYFPLEFGKLASEIRCHQFRENEALETGGASIRPFPLNHPQGCSGFRIEAAGAVVVYATDHEHGDPVKDRILRQQSEGADILICDSQYLPEEYESHRGWGHTTWIEAVKIAKDASVKKLLLFHHDPGHDDHVMCGIEQAARERFENTEAAREGFVATL